MKEKQTKQDKHKYKHNKQITNKSNNKKKQDATLEKSKTNTKHETRTNDK